MGHEDDRNRTALRHPLVERLIRAVIFGRVVNGAFNVECASQNGRSAPVVIGVADRVEVQG